MKRRHFIQTTSLAERLLYDVEQLRQQAEKLAPGPAQDTVLRKIRQNETAAHISDWLNSPGLRPPKALEDMLAIQKK
ncbi:hypothetical protein [Bradyrhizobium sp. URHC0002]